MKKLSIVILAAGLGSRMKSALPKPLHKIGGKPMLEHVLESARKLNPDRLIVVYGHRGEELQAAFTHHEDITWAKQETFEGTGDAMKYALPYTIEDSTVLVLYGDTPLIRAETLEELVKNAENTRLNWLISSVENPTGYGRIIRDHNHHMIAIIEEKDANETEKEIKEINTGIFAICQNFLKEALPQIDNDNQQNEYYLTDVAKLAVQNGITIHTIEEDPAVIQGVNDRIQLANLERYYQQEMAKQLMLNGITIDHPDSLTIRGRVQNDLDCHIEANVILEGKVILGKNVVIRTGSVLKNVVIDDNTIIHPYSVIENASIGANASIGPFARIRENSKLGDNTRIGNFVETKNSTLAEGAKASHLAYLGDATIGKESNIGAGVITCNYDGANKHQTIIGDHAFIGSNSSLVAPVKIGNHAATAAGSIVPKDVKDHTLVRNRLEAIHVENWEIPKKGDTKK
ncbi:bifunctional protein GlmU [Ignatzschineria indica]|uniref:Bifunctional protein GlmU n=1 Tax=Ignatzschineria indica TaxID=472583 RepID=A0A2U2AJ25_9GAMM|nr:bifunctional UDP-N-acetylglucosamine diphosphorylase/glucosamine-1-phosphate N-acetyltransferase GlmU [Ignatzschineria indica]PWD82670.1 UDP-N-acetylglucosamine diphosphorylase/glucosamine-1-phosphate N-acetyltransferase [Ignatzschineria indica]GGZ86018.1 bifunctional protein GlmU [Ignatzschineria indica]